MNPDGTGQMTFFGNMHPGTVMIDAKSVPGTNEVISTFLAMASWSAGALTLLDLGDGPTIGLGRGRRSARTSATRSRSTPTCSWPRWITIRIYERGGTWVPLCATEDVARGLWIHEPRPLRAAQPAPIASGEPEQSRRNSDPDRPYHGRRLDGVERGRSPIYSLSSLPKPINYTGGWIH